MASIVKGSADYYPFGSQFPERQDLDYRYAYQGQEKDAETGMEAFELRLWDSRIGRWLTPDPMGQHASPYLGMSNRPNMNVDSDGGWDDWWESSETGEFKWFDGGEEAAGKAALEGYDIYRGTSHTYESRYGLVNLYDNGNWSFALGPSLNSVKDHYKPSFPPEIGEMASMGNSASIGPTVLSAMDMTRTTNMMTRQFGNGVGNGMLDVGTGAIAGKIIRSSLSYYAYYRSSSASIGRVFWSGGGNSAVEAAARQFATNNGMTTLEMTRAGQNLANLTEGLPWSTQGPMWHRMSAAYAEGAKGTVHVFHNAEGIGLKSAWGTVEYPILRRNNVKIIYHLVY